MKSKLRRLRHRSLVFSHDMVMVAAAWLLAYWLRFDLGRIPEGFLERGLDLLPVVLAIQGVTFMLFGLYRGVWRFASLPDLVRIGKAVMAGTGCAIVVVFLITRLELVPRSVFPFYAILLMVFLGSPRLIYRWIKDQRLYSEDLTNVLVVGAGSAGEMLVRDMLRSKGAGFRPVAFLDDDPAKAGKEIHGIRVLGKTDRLPKAVAKYDVDIVLIAIPSADSKQMRRIVELCERVKVPFRTLPAMKEIYSGRVGLKELREVSINDLLGREPVSLDWKGIHDLVDGRRVLVTGGGGSIGSELCRQVANLMPEALCIIDNSEYNAFRIQQELRSSHPDLDLVVRLVDVCDRVAVDRLFKDFRPELVFHAAAYKHVPLLEDQIREAVRTNVLGTRNVARAAIETRCSKFTLISTDKAVNPTNVMGATKKAAEIVCQHAGDGTATRFMTVRFGNVLGSVGSVVPIFRRQIERGGPVTVTHRDITRYFMTIPEATQLILQAGALGKGGEIFVLDMGEPIRIAYLAEQMIRLSGREPGTDIEIAYTGLRPGEKMEEELFHGDERVSSTSHEKILLARSRRIDREVVDQLLSRLEQVSVRFDDQDMEGALRTLVPEWETKVPERTADIIHLNNVSS